MTDSKKPVWFYSPWPFQFILLVLAFLWILFFGNPLETPENRWYDACLRWRFQNGFAKAADPRIVHLDITNADLAKLPTLESEYQAAGQWIEEATKLGAEMMVVDIIFNRGNSDMAQPILDSIRKSRGIILAEGKIASLSHLHDERVRSFPFLEDSQTSTGIINITADSDGVYRHYSYVYPSHNSIEPSLALAAYFTLKGVNWPKDVTLASHTLSWQELSADGLKLVSKSLRAHPGSPSLLDFRTGWRAGGPAAFPHFTLEELHQLFQRSRENNDKPLAGKIVFVSYVATGISDFGTTSFGANQPLVHLHSTALNDLLQNTSHMMFGRKAVLLSLLAIPLLSAFAFICRTKIMLTGLWVAGIVIFISANAVLIFKTHFVPPTVLWTLLWTLSVLLELVRRHTYEFIERVKLRTAVSYYFPPKVLKRVLATPGIMEPQQVELTVLLTDIRNFTPISEHLGTRGVFALCNKVFEVETRTVMAEEGSIEHFLGDQFLSYWGAPDPQPDGADRALRASLALIDAMEKLRGNLEGKVQELFGYGVALHSGIAMIGNKGSTQRMDYGVLGDLINSAARVESLTKYYGVRLIMTHETVAKLSEPPAKRLLDVIIPAGKSTSMELFEIKNPVSSPHFDQIRTDYHAAFERYRRGDFKAAQKEFINIAHSYGDIPSHRLAERCKQFLDRAPVKWSGTYQFTSK